MKERLHQLKDWYLSHERHIATSALFLGFVVDNLTLQRIDRVFDNAVIFTYLILIGGGLLFVNLAKAGRLSESFRTKVLAVAPVLIQFAFGGVFSAFFIFYRRSATLASSWPFMLFLLSLLIGNEFFRKQYMRLRFQVTIFFVTLFSFFVYFVPVVIKKMNTAVFLLSGILSVCSIALFIMLLEFFLFDVVRPHRRWFVATIGAVFIGLNILYFTNSIPPIPLSLKDIDLAHKIVRSGDEYTLVVEDVPFWERWLPGETYHQRSGEGAGVFSSVFAPTDLKITIRHCWDYFDTARDTWQEMQCVSFPIAGGRGEGYRGYSLRRSLMPGKWRVDVETERGQLIGRKVFTVEAAVEQVVLETRTR